jgi:hypothetical protein
MDNLPAPIAPGLDQGHLESEFRSLEGCCLHSPVWTPADVEKILCCVSDGGEGWGEPTGWTAPGNIGYTDTRSYTVVRLKGGTFGLLSESSDTTGHGCQCDAATNTFASVGDLLQFGVVEDGARTLIRQLLAVPGAVVADSGELEAAPEQAKAVGA